MEEAFVPEPKAKDLLAMDVGKTLANKISERDSQELVVALVGPVGSGVSTSARLIKELLSNEYGYDVEILKQSTIIANEGARVGFANIPESPLSAYIETMQSAGNALRTKFGPNYLAEKTVESIYKHRRSKGGFVDGQVQPGRRAYIVDSIKNVDELLLLRSIYRDALCLFGVFAPDQIRQQRLKDNGALEADVTKLIKRDLGESGTFGQMTRKVFSFADFYVCNDQKIEELRRKLARFLEIIFDTGIHTPTREEDAMTLAMSAGAGSACMSRQVGACIVSESGELIATGCNDVPKYGGGLYTENDQSVWDGAAIQDHDRRCFKWGGSVCHNDQLRSGILTGIVKSVLSSRFLKKGTSETDIREAVGETDVDDLIEFSRAIHAEMEAILSVAREGKHSLVGATLYSTVYPCHSCARHIVAAGIRDVIYIHPYRKSKAIALHHDAISENPLDRENRVLFRQYDGVAPANFLKCFNATRERKNGGTFVKNLSTTATPIFKIPLDAQLDYESKVIADLASKEHNV
jgi:deoxycytidylate deaminase